MVEDDNYDINVSPDKREVFIKNEQEVLEALKCSLTQFFEDIQRVKAYDTSEKAQANRSSGKLIFATSESKKRTLDEFELDKISISNSQTLEQEGGQKRIPLFATDEVHKQSFGDSALSSIPELS